MPGEERKDGPGRPGASARRAAVMLLRILPVIVGMVMLTGLLMELVPLERIAGWFGGNELIDALVGSLAGSVAVGHPLSSYILGGELREQGVTLVAVTAFLVSWVTVGVVQLPAEMLILGRRFAVYRNLLCFIASILVAWLSVATLGLAG